mmetsp:Transcript_26371/g.59469  ORF Transcript_26371/g.59469 Transcript_26371/m.59469 type:complete len:274 (+) Transcript_26371:1237-2058(+)
MLADARELGGIVGPPDVHQGHVARGPRRAKRRDQVRRPHEPRHRPERPPELRLPEARRVRVHDLDGPGLHRPVLDGARVRRQVGREHRSELGRVPLPEVEAAVPAEDHGAVAQLEGAVARLPVEHSAAGDPPRQLEERRRDPVGLPPHQNLKQRAPALPRPVAQLGESPPSPVDVEVALVPPLGVGVPLLDLVRREAEELAHDALREGLDGPRREERGQRGPRRLHRRVRGRRGRRQRAPAPSRDEGQEGVLPVDPPGLPGVVQGLDEAGPRE